MALIDEMIPVQGFEIVTIRLGAILLTELSNQKVLDNTIDNFGVFIDRTEPYANEEDTMINVSMNNISFANQTQKGSQGDVNFYIDIFTKGFASQNESGNDNVRQHLHRFLGMVRYIFNSTKYKTLEFPQPLIGGVYVQSIQVDDNYGNQDGSFNRMARLTLSVRVNEEQDLWNRAAVPLLGNDTTMTLSNTSKGQKLIFNNEI